MLKRIGDSMYYQHPRVKSWLLLEHYNEVLESMALCSASFHEGHVEVYSDPRQAVVSKTPLSYFEEGKVYKFIPDNSGWEKLEQD